MSSYKGKLTLFGVTYDVEVINGERRINGMPLLEFVLSLPREQKLELAKIGARALDAERNGEEYSPMQDYKEMQLKKN